jgi:hypothetical protein
VSFPSEAGASQAVRSQAGAWERGLKAHRKRCGDIILFLTTAH